MESSAEGHSQGKRHHALETERHVGWLPAQQILFSGLAVGRSSGSWPIKLKNTSARQISFPTPKKFHGKFGRQFKAAFIFRSRFRRLGCGAVLGC